MSDHDLILRETIARHFPAATVEDRVVKLGVDDLSIECWVNHVGDALGITQTSLFFLLRGAVLGPDPVFASVSGYGPTAEEAITTGACNWACSFGPVLRAGLSDEAVPDVSELSVEIDGQEFDVFVDSLDRTLVFGDGLDPTDIGRAARARFGKERWLTEVVIDSGILPLLPSDRPTVLSVFVSDTETNRIVELKIDGADWPHAKAVFADVDHEKQPAATLMRELAILVPSSKAPRLARDPIAVALGGIGDPTLPRDIAQWPGWKQHGGLLRSAYPESVVADFEKMSGPLPADYRAFLLSVGSSGAGPGYGLIDPISAFQGRIMPGDFAWEHDAEPTTPPRGVLGLAHGGCGVMWLLVLGGPHRGEVWLDARSSDGKARRVAASFDAWYRDWLAASVRNVHFVQWDPNSCATANAFRQVIDHLSTQGVADDQIQPELVKVVKPGALKLSTDSVYFGEGTNLNPCFGCVTIAKQLGLDTTVFAPGTEPA